MSDAGRSGSRFRYKRRGRRRSRRNRGPRFSVPAAGAAAKEKAEESPPKKVFIYTYTIRKSG